MLFRPLAVAALLALAVPVAADARMQTCSVPLGDGARLTLRIDDRGRAVNALWMDFVQPINGSLHECSLRALRGDGRSRWRADGTATYMTMDGPAGRFVAVAQRYRGDIQVSVSDPGGERASCGAFTVPGTVIVTPKTNGSCLARLPRRP